MSLPLPLPFPCPCPTSLLPRKVPNTNRLLSGCQNAHVRQPPSPPLVGLLGLVFFSSGAMFGFRVVGRNIENVAVGGCAPRMWDFGFLATPASPGGSIGTQNSLVGSVFGPQSVRGSDGSITASAGTEIPAGCQVPHSGFAQREWPYSVQTDYRTASLSARQSGSAGEI